MNTQLTKLILSTITALTIVACGGTGVGTGLAGIGGSGFIASGSISGFGSVFVNGVEYETDSATFNVDGVSGTQDDLAIGMIVQVTGTINEDGVTGTATSIVFDEELQGEVSALTPPDVDGIARSFTVLGTNVIINSSSTSFDISDNVPTNTPFGFSDIANNNNVEISGFFDTTGSLIATRVELEDQAFDTNSIIEFKGIISSLSGTTFNIGSLVIDASSAMLEDLPNGLANGQFVEVKGTLDAGTITANIVEGEESSVEDTDEFELEGLITDHVSDSDFKISGVSIDASNATLLPATLLLTNDIRVEAEGTIVDGILIATEVELRGGNAKVRATVSNIDTINNTFDVVPVAGQPAITISVSSSTKLEDDVNEIKPFSFNNLVIDDYVEVRGFDDGNGKITATEVQVKTPEGILLQGVIQSGASVNTVKIFGVEFIIDDLGETEFEGLDDVNISQAKFFATVTLDSSVIKVEDKDIVNGIADEVEIESP
jgi:hypothetical protein